MAWFPKLRFKKEYLERLTSPRAKKRISPDRAKESDAGPKVFRRICARCQVTRPHTLTELGHYKCTICGTESMERFMRLTD